MIDSLVITIIIESMVVLGYSFWRRKPARSLLVTSVWVNILTQSLLWIGLNLFFRDYRVTLLISEIAIWGIESFLLCIIPANRLDPNEATLLSLGMNASSFTIGWFLPT